jgi:tetratricopeptide (TPR) repeat protein
MNTSELEGMKCVKWSKNFIAKSEEWIYRLEGIDEIADAAVALASRTQVKPSKTLLDFYKSLSINESNTENSASKDGNTELTCSEVHGKIGDFYVQAQKNDEALSAYLRALQWDPQNEHAQEELFKIFKNNSGRFHDFLEKKAWILEGDWFHHKQEFVNYIHGIISFKSEQFEQALTFFSQIVDDETSYPIALAFIISSLRLEGRNTEAENRLGENINIAEVLLFHFNICKSYALCKLGESERKYPYSDLIQREKERIRNRNLI